MPGRGCEGGVNGVLRPILVFACTLAIARGLPAGGPDKPSPAFQQASGQDAKETQQPAARDPQVKAVLDKMAAAGVLHPATVEEVRKAFPFYATLSGKPERVFRAENRAIPGPAGNIPVRIYIPHRGRGLPILVFFHGGGFVAGSLDTHDTVLRAVTNRCGCVVVSVGYRLAPENPYPAAPDDAYAATKWVADHAPEIGGDARRIAVGGDGAGGNLAAVVTLMARDRGGPQLVYQVLIYPSLNAIVQASRYISKDPILTPDTQAAILGAYVPLTHDLQDPFISPVYAKSLKNLPQALVVTDEDDPARDEGDAYAKKLAADGVHVKVSPYPNMIHGFLLMAGELDAANKAIAEISEGLKGAFERATSSPSERKGAQ